MFLSKQHIKAFFIAMLSFKFPVSWGRPRTRKRCMMLSLKWHKHPWIVKFLEWPFDVRCRMDGGIELWFRDKERQKINQRRFLKRLKDYVERHA